MTLFGRCERHERVEHFGMRFRIGAQAFLIRIGILDDERLQPLRMRQDDAKADRPAIVMKVEGVFMTIEVLLTSPATEAQIVLAKFAASMSLLLLMLALSVAYAVVLAIYGDPDWGPIFSGYLGLVLLGAALVGLGLLTSALTANQIIAALLSLSAFLLLWIIDEFGYLLPDPFDTLVVNLSLSVHFKPFATGSLYFSDVAFYLSAAVLALFLSVRALAWR